MKFWKRLRWISTAAFAALLLWSWWVGDMHPVRRPIRRTHPFTHLLTGEPP